MEEKHSHFFLALQQRLSQPLPGVLAHQKMASSVRSANTYRAVPSERTRRSAVLLLLYPYQHDLWLPLILRPAYDGVHGGQMAFPGGGYEYYDRSLVNTALREAQEEVGIKATDVHVLGQLTQLYIPPSNFLVQPVVGYLPYCPDFFPDSREVAGIVEVNLSTLADKNIIGSKELFVRNVVIQAPFYNIQENTVWGATAMMLSEFLMILEEVSV